VARPAEGVTEGAAAGKTAQNLRPLHPPLFGGRSPSLVLFGT